jgi:hypothetical protein
LWQERRLNSHSHIFICLQEHKEDKNLGTNRDFWQTLCVTCTFLQI